jgi:uncharacterized protein YlaN (UPF0358 family)
MAAELDEILRYAIPLAAVAVSWGQTRTEVQAMQEQLKELDKELDEAHDTFMKRSECRDQHQRNEKAFDELKADVKEIKKLLIEFMGRPQA